MKCRGRRCVYHGGILAKYEYMGTSDTYFILLMALLDEASLPEHAHGIAIAAIHSHLPV